MDETFDVFLSYSREDSERAALVRDELEALGLKVFFDAEGVDAGAEFPIVIDRAVKGSKCVLGLWSQTALQSRWVRIESRIGLDQSKLVAAVIDATKPEQLPAEFYNVNIEDLSDFNGEPDHPGWVDVLRAIGRRVGRADLAGRAAPRRKPAAAAPRAATPQTRSGQSALANSPIVWALGGALAVALIVILFANPFGAAREHNAAPAGGQAEASAPANVNAPLDNSSRADAISANLDREAAVRRQIETERAALQQGCEGGDLDSCRTYITNFASTDFATAARSKIEDLTRPVATDLTGAWVGYYVQAGARTMFNVDISGEPGAFRGRMVEIASFGGGPATRLTANIVGRTDANGAVAFRKTYDGTGGQTHSVSYEGAINADGTISGTWSLANQRGEFRMQRR